MTVLCNADECSSLFLHNIVRIMEIRAASLLTLILQRLAKISDWHQNICWFSQLYGNNFKTTSLCSLWYLVVRSQGTGWYSEVVDFNNELILEQYFRHTFSVYIFISPQLSSEQFDWKT